MRDREAATCESETQGKHLGRFARFIVIAAFSPYAFCVQPFFRFLK